MTVPFIPSLLRLGCISNSFMYSNYQSTTKRRRNSIIYVMRRFCPMPSLSFQAEKLMHKVFLKDQSIEVSTRSGFAVTVSDLSTLKGTSWLNDEVINFYFCLISETANANCGPEVYYHYFNTFFYPTLCRRGYDGVKKWTKNLQIFKLKKIIIPIHLGNHWCFSYIDMPSRVIYYFDSLGGRNDVCLNTLLGYLQEEHMKFFACSLSSDWRLVHAEVGPFLTFRISPAKEMAMIAVFLPAHMRSTVCAMPT